MFDFSLGDELELVVETARSFAATELQPRIREHEDDRAVGSGIRRTYAEMGLSGLEIPESLGGAELGAIARVLVNEEIAAGDAGAALALDPLGPALYPLAEMGGFEAVEEFAVPLLESPGSRAVLITNFDGSLTIDQETVSGTVPWVPAERVDLAVILLADEAIVVRAGITPSSLRGGGLRAAGASELRFEGAPIEARWTDVQGAGRARARARLYVAALLVGVMRQAAEFSRSYALGREAFGRPIAHHQGLAFLITDMHTAVDGSRCLLHEAAWRIGAGLPGETAAAACFVDAVEASTFVGPNGLQILGGHGFMQDYPVEKYMREARILGLMLGGVDVAREDAGSELPQASGNAALSHVEGGA